MIAFVALTYAGAMLVTRATVNRSDPVWGLSATFLHSLIPIMIGYTIAHYFSLFVFQGQAGYILASDPLGTGLNLLGTAEWTIDYTVVSTATIAIVQIAATVTGHVIGIVAAHDRAVGVFTGRDKTRGQYALLAVMVVYTVGGIALLVGT